MAYQQYDEIDDSHYNGFITSVNKIWGGGSGDFGYGQTTTLPSVSEGVEVSATQWANLIDKVNSAAAHQNTTLGAINDPVTGNDITAKAVLTSNINNIAIKRLYAKLLGTTSVQQTIRTSQWNQAITMTQNITFTSYSHLRYFINSGGLIRVEFDRSGGTGHPKDQAWSALCDACGAIYMSSDGTSKVIAGTTYHGTTKIGGAGSVNIIATTAGVHNLNSAYQRIFRQYYTPSYTGSYSSGNIDVFAKISNNVISIRTVYNDDDAGPTDEYVTGTLTTGMTLYHPSTVNIANSWGTPVLTGSQTGS